VNLIVRAKIVSSGDVRFACGLRCLSCRFFFVQICSPRAAVPWRHLLSRPLDTLFRSVPVIALKSRINSAYCTWSSLVLAKDYRVEFQYFVGITLRLSVNRILSLVLTLIFHLLRLVKYTLFYSILLSSVLCYLIHLLSQTLPSQH